MVMAFHAMIACTGNVLFKTLEPRDWLVAPRYVLRLLHVLCHPLVKPCGLRLRMRAALSLSVQVHDSVSNAPSKSIRIVIDILSFSLHFARISLVGCKLQASGRTWERYE